MNSNGSSERTRQRTIFIPLFYLLILCMPIQAHSRPVEELRVIIPEKCALAITFFGLNSKLTGVTLNLVDTKTGKSFENPIEVALLEGAGKQKRSQSMVVRQDLGFSIDFTSLIPTQSDDGPTWLEVCRK